MEIRPIRTEADYRAALREIERLWDGEPGTSAGDHVEILVTLIEAYEARHYPIPVPDPIAACLLYTSPSPRDLSTSRMPSSA